ncbi:hypothetical protein V512_000425 [Mesotoga sp. Brook.08.105.5.1]|jgi:CubicO group peptidase (beta-lactamase class C family)|uniref:serine hydrolase domain-containing protein n=1 Tax=Mesotoga sp. Brook.08.105.5.1 TaxID=1421002 RepID=UPI000C176C57|nr:serine hydrolase domain-containing protein [Mesotoga sp. Brook.08.105.5.1]PVD15412.1 hypothetical protein V512_000425 [Mesotoga sp. Brook.08.105.5.1]
MNLRSFRKRFAEITSELEKLVTEGEIPGISCGVRFKDTVETASLGVTNINHPLKVSDETFFQIGSITKTFVALAVMRLVDAGRIDLERPIKELLEDFALSDKGAEEKITMKHLLTHTSGMKGDYFKDFGYGKDALEKLVRNMSSLPQINPPGRILSYCNSGFYVAGRVIEAVTGKTFEEAIIELVSKPLGLENIHFFPEDIITERFAVGHLITEDRISVALPWAVGRAIHPAGGIITNIKELLNYSAFYFSDRASDRNGIISDDSFTKLITGKIDASPASKVALGWFVEEIDGVATIQHGGGTNGQISLLMVFPEIDFSAAILTNSNEGSKATSLFSRMIVEDLLELNPVITEPATNYLERAEKIAGLYRGEMSDLEIFIEQGKSFIKEIPRVGFPDEDSEPAPPSTPQEISISDEGFIINLSEPYLASAGEFIVNESGRIEGLRIGLRIYNEIGS